MGGRRVAKIVGICFSGKINRAGVRSTEVLREGYYPKQIEQTAVQDKP